MNVDDRTETIYGGFDGIVSAIGVVAPVLIAAGFRPRQIVIAAVGLAISSGWSMGSGQYISDAHSRIRLAVVMGVATLIFSLLPAVPFLFGAGRLVGAIAGGAVTFLTGVLIAELRPGARGPSYALTFAVLGVGVALAVGWGFIAP